MLKTNTEMMKTFCEWKKNPEVSGNEESDDKWRQQHKGKETEKIKWLKRQTVLYN